MAARRRRAREADGFPRGSGIVRRVGIGLGAQAAALVRVDAEVRVRLQRCGALECQPPLTCSHHHADRLIAALEEAQSAGGDIRGRQSAALLIVAAESTGKPWVDRRFDLRIEDHPTPVAELKRLVRLQRAYLHMNAGDLAIEHADFATASREYAAAEKLAPDIVEIPFWHAVTLAAGGRVDASLPIFRSVFAREPFWADLVPRLVRAEILPDDAELLKKIDAQK